MATDSTQYKYDAKNGLYNPNNFTVAYGDGVNQPTYYSEIQYAPVKQNFDSFTDFKNAIINAGGTEQNALDDFFHGAQFGGYGAAAIGINSDQSKQRAISDLQTISSRAGMGFEDLLNKNWDLYGKGDGWGGQYTGGWGWWGPESFAIQLADTAEIDPQNYKDFYDLAKSYEGAIGAYGTASQNAAGDHGSFMSNVLLPTLAIAAPAFLGGGGLGNLFGGGGASLFPGEAVIGNAFNPYGGSLLSSLGNAISSIPSGISQLFNGAGTAGAASGAGGNNMSVFDVLAGDDAAAGAGMLNNGWQAYNPTVSIPGVGDVYGSPASILQNFNNLIPGAGTAANVVKSIFGGNGSLLGAGLGALLGGMGANQKPAGTVTSVQDIPDYLKPYQSMNLASGLSNMQQAGAGAQLLPGSQQYMADQIAGKYLDPNRNPAFQPYVKDLMGQAGSQFMSAFGGRPDNLNNSGVQEGYTRAITNAVLPLYNSAFQTAQGNQFNAAANAPGYANNVAGAALAPNLAFKNLYTGPQATTSPYFTNTMGGALSGGLAGYTLGNSIFGGK